MLQVSTMQSEITLSTAKSKHIALHTLLWDELTIKILIEEASNAFNITKDESNH